MPEFYLGIAAAALYLTASIQLARQLWRQDYASRNRAGLLAMIALVLQGIILKQEIFTEHGLDLAFFHAGSLVTWVMTAVFLIAAGWRPLEGLEIAVLLLATLGLGSDLLFHSPQVVEPRSLGLDLHIAFSILAYSLLAIAALQAILLGVQDFYLRHKRPGWLIRRFPPLVAMEALLFHLISLGFALLTLALAEGFAFLQDISAKHMLNKVILAVFAWIVFAILLWGRLRFGWRGRLAIRGTLLGFAVLLLAYFGTKLFSELLI